VNSVERFIRVVAVLAAWGRDLVWLRGVELHRIYALKFGAILLEVGIKVYSQGVDAALS